MRQRDDRTGSAASVLNTQSSALPLVDHLQEVAEQIERVVRAGGGLGVVLHGQDRLAAVAEAFQRLVVEVDVRELDVVLAERVGVDGEAVVLRGDLDPAAAQVLDRMVAAAVAELQLVRLAAEGQAEELVAEADPEDRRPCRPAGGCSPARTSPARDRRGRSRAPRRRSFALRISSACVVAG